MTDDPDVRIAFLEADCDLRCAELMMLALEVDDWDFNGASSFIRAAYAQGFADATRDPHPEEWFHSHGYQAPRRREAA